MAKEMKLGWLYRGLAGFICLAALVPFFGSPGASIAHYLDDWYAALCIVLGLPLFLYCAVFGKVPPFLTNHLNADAFEDYSNVDRIFTEFNAKSIAAAIVASGLIGFALYHYS